MNPRLTTYIDNLRSALAPHFAPNHIYHGASGALRLAREVGYGLADFSDTDIQSIRTSLYSSLLVRFTFTSAAGVPIDNRAFQSAISDGIVRSRAYIERIS